MSSPPSVHMPGAFYFDNQPSSGVHPGIFRPPTSPSASSSAYISKSSSSLPAGTAAPGKRKRQHNTDREPAPSHNWVEGRGEDGTYGVASPGLTPRLGRKSSNGEKPYILAGQIATPGGDTHIVGNGILDESVYSDADYRTALGSKRPHEEMESPASRHTTLIHPSQHPSSEAWSRLAFEAIGGVVGKVWEFCTASAFRGFYAGGGTGFALQSPAYQASGATGGGWSNEDDAPTLNASEMAPPLPGTFPEPENLPPLPSYTGKGTPESTPSRPSVKRRQISENDDLRRNWVIVDELASEERRKRPSMTRRRPSQNSPVQAGNSRRISVPVSKLNSTPGLPRRHSHRISHAGSPNLSARAPASFAAPRSPRALSPSVPSPSRIPVSARPSSSLGSNPFAVSSLESRKTGIPSPIQTAFAAGTSHRRTHSGASAASSRVKPRDHLDEDDIEASPRLGPEAKQLATRRLKEERDTDVRMKNFNARLKEMIRQGKEALGTTVVVDGGEAGWEDDC